MSEDQELLNEAAGAGPGKCETDSSFSVASKQGSKSDSVRPSTWNSLRQRSSTSGGVR